jgi:hypothetical protein
MNPKKAHTQKVMRGYLVMGFVFWGDFIRISKKVILWEVSVAWLKMSSNVTKKRKGKKLRTQFPITPMLAPQCF